VRGISLLAEEVPGTVGLCFVESVGLSTPNHKQQYIDSESCKCLINTAYLADTKDVGVSRASLGAVEEFTHTREAEKAVESDDNGAGDPDLGGGGGPPQVS
jgi:hypothetical protein